eukprot:1369972-Pleurochrysis_carterae.AAC.1
MKLGQEAVPGLHWLPSARSGNNETLPSPCPRLVGVAEHYLCASGSPRSMLLSSKLRLRSGSLRIANMN